MKENYRTSSDSGSFGAFSNPDYYILLKDVAKNWWVIALTGVIITLIFRILPMIGYTPTYTASTTVLVTGTIRNDDSFSTYSGTAQQFANLLTDDYLLQEIAEDMQVRKLNVKVNASIIADTNVVSLTVQAAKPTTAYRVLKGILEHYPDISELMYPGYVLEQLIPPEYPSAPDPNPLSGGNTRKYALATMAAMTALIVLLSMFYDNVCNEKDAVNKLDARLLTTVYHEKKRFSMGFGKKKRKQSILYTYPAVSFGFVQSYKKLREKITSRCDVSGKKVILITSMLENEGKSTVAANLALSLAAVSDKVLLLDADLRRPAQYKIFDHEKHHETALSDYLKGSADLSASLFYDEGRGLYMLYNQKECMESSELESSQRMKELIETLKEQMDYIIIDTSPISQITDDGFSVEMKDVDFSYLKGNQVITDSAFCARPGEIVALVGPSGEGKTTMIRLILGLIRPEKGRVSIQWNRPQKENGDRQGEKADAVNIDRLEVEMNADTRHLFAYVPQGNTILSGTIAENLRMVKEDATDEELIEALKIACAWDFVEKMPKGIDSMVMERGRGLSEGQAQRIAIARAVLRDSPILLLDEATSALDVTTERMVLRNIVQQRPNKTCIVTTHRPSVLNLCQRVYRVMETRVTELSEEESARMAMDF